MPGAPAGGAAPTGPRSYFYSFKGGLQELSDAIVASLPPERLHGGSAVRTMAPCGAGSGAYALQLADGSRVVVDAVVLATPAWASGDLLRTVAPLPAADLSSIEYVSTATASSGLTLDTAGARVFVQVFSPPMRCFVVGAVHIAQPLTQMLALTGYRATVIDPRQSFATEARFPGVELTTDWPDEALERLKPDHRSAVVTLTHDPKLDDPALAVALRSDCFYIGALGSKRTHARRLERLTELGFGEPDFARIRGPIGLPIGAVSQAEIAVSILAEMTRCCGRAKTNSPKESRSGMILVRRPRETPDRIPGERQTHCPTARAVA